MTLTVELAKAFNLSPFEIFKQDKDSVLMLIDYYLLQDEKNETPARPAVVHCQQPAGYSDPLWNYI